MTIDQGGHPADGSTGAWLIQENQTAAWGDLSTRTSGWEIFGMGKTAAGKNTDDVYIRNSDNLIGAWSTNNDGKVTGWMGLGDLGDVTVEQIADFNGDGVDDLRIRTTAGDIGVQLVMGADTLDWHYYGAAGEEWKTGLAALN